VTSYCSSLPQPIRWRRTNRTDLMTNHSQQIFQKLWNYCNILRNDGLSLAPKAEEVIASL
jgi:hypothetical protein